MQIRNNQLFRVFPAYNFLQIHIRKYTENYTYSPFTSFTGIDGLLTINSKLVFKLILLSTAVKIDPVYINFTCK